MSAFRILHLSDIHIGNTYKSSEDIAYKVISDIDNNGLCSIKSVIVTGDIFDGRALVSDGLINEAVSFFEIILEEINLNQGEYKIAKSDFIFIPGNHDLIRKDDEIERWSKYRNFLLKFYEVIPECYNQKNFSVIKQYDKEKIVFIGFNSCQIEKKRVFDSNYLSIFKKNADETMLCDHGIDKKKLLEILENEVVNEYDDFGHVSMSQITEVRRKIKNLNDYNVIALFHHHFYLFPEIAREFGDSSLIRNYSEVTNQLKYMNVRTVLHGHKHFDLERPYITDDYYETTESIIDVFAGGSVGVAGKEKHTFNVLDFYEKKDNLKLIHNKFTYNDELFSITKKQIPPQNVATRVVKLLEMLKTANPNAHNDYTDTVEKIFKIYKTCNEITNWISEAITGFNEVYKFLDDDYRNISFLLYAINYRTLNYKAIVENEVSYFDSASMLLKDYFNNQLATTNFTISSDDYHALFGEKKLKDIANKCDQLLNTSSNKTTQLYLAFSMVGIFFSDLYLVLTEYADDFKESIKYKVNIKIEENKFHENVPAPRIVIQCDSDRRSAYIQLLCNEATAHKMAVLFVKEFDLMINKFEDYFKLIGLKLYYLIPKIDNNKMKDTLDNYNFEAYIPTLLPLLTGDNIYPSKVVFARELIQNSIDAIAVREAKDSIEFSKKIIIDIGKEMDGKRYFKIRDEGTGMDRYKIERYFTSIGRSFYSGDEYADLNISYKPISSFGIGFLSSFMVCKEISVKTKYFLPNSESLRLHIPNYDGCFFIEHDNNIDVGTELKLHLNNAVENKTIVKYIRKTMLDIKYDIVINTNDENIVIPANQIREEYRSEKFKFFIPFSGSDEVLDIDYEKEVISGEFINKYEYGIFICKNYSKKNTRKFAILNAGILVEQASFNSLFEIDIEKNYHPSYYNDKEQSYNNIYMNLPANWIQIDVSREKLAGFSEHIKKTEGKNPQKSIGIRIAEALHKQITSLLQYSKTKKVDLPVMYLQEVIQYSLSFCGKNHTIDIYRKLMELKYKLNVRFTADGITLELTRRGKGDEKSRITFEDELARVTRNNWKERLQFDISDEQVYIKNSEIVTGELNELRYILLRELQGNLLRRGAYKNLELSSETKRLVLGMDPDMRFEHEGFVALLSLFLVGMPEETIEKDKEKVHFSLVLLEIVAMKRIKISDVENGNNHIYVTYNEMNEFFGKSRMTKEIQL